MPRSRVKIALEAPAGDSFWWSMVKMVNSAMSLDVSLMRNDRALWHPLVHDYIC